MVTIEARIALWQDRAQRMLDRGLINQAARALEMIALIKAGKV